MKKILLLLLPVVLMIAASCGKEKTSERFQLLTAHVWASDSLLADGVKADGPGQILEKFKGDVTFREDGTGTFGQYSGTWVFTDNETNLAIDSPDLPITLPAHIVELTANSLKVTLPYPGATIINVRMTFKPK
ncbi:MAG: hypothetical protein GX622_12595 [Bacteroidales bacterium]|jgi:hypothetical protein|nr:hypothetical protein [Bacteroidales bacterium]